jgi:hypothetical protein
MIVYSPLQRPHLERLIAGHRIAAGDVLDVDRDGDRLAFYRTSRDDHAVMLP